MVTENYAINKKNDFDLYLNEFFFGQRSMGPLGRYLGRFCGLLFVLKNAKVVHIPFSGGVLGNTIFWRLEAQILAMFGIKSVVIPYGADAHMYSKILNTSARNALLIDYPLAARNEKNIAKRVNYWVKYADCIITGAIVYGMPRWDVVTPSPLCINAEKIFARVNRSNFDGVSGVVVVAHAPNHRGFKGTEYLIESVKRLNEEGLQVELRLLEGLKNDQVLVALQEVDILAEQFIAGGYALNAIEGMASGLPVLSNLDDQNRTILFKRYSFLGECPILSTTPENLTQNLRTLVTNPHLREDLGRAGRFYVEKYHSYKTAQYLFTAVYEKIVEGKPVDLMNLFHPLKSKFNNK
jgi:glycosyltransferase involved in cell wall biosynthesis